MRVWPRRYLTPNWAVLRSDLPARTLEFLDGVPWPDKSLPSSPEWPVTGLPVRRHLLTTHRSIGWVRLGEAPDKAARDPAYPVGPPPSSSSSCCDISGRAAAAWSAPPRGEPVEVVGVDPLLIRRVGRASPVLDAYDNGLPGPLVGYRPVYRRCACGCGAELARGGTRYFDDDHRRRARNARRRKPRQTERNSGCPVDARPLSGPRSTYCSRRCRETAREWATTSCFAGTRSSPNESGPRTSGVEPEQLRLLRQSIRCGIE